MYIALAHKHYNAEHLEAVKSEMITKGAPVIRAVYMECYDCYVALEGCHRIRAAKDLGLTPVITEIEYDDIKDLPMNSDGFDFDNDNTFESFLDDAHRRTMINF